MRKKDVIRYFGTQAALARALGINRQSIQDWGDQVPEGRQWQLEVVTNGVLRATRPKPERRVN